MAVDGRVLGLDYKWVAAVTVMIGTFMTLLDTTIVDITLPKMISSLNTDTYGIQWVVISYMIGSAVAMTAVGWLGATLSYRTVYLLGFGLFVLCSALCGQASTLGFMVASRLFQGIGEGLVVPIAMTYLFLVFPKEEAGLAMGIYGLGASFAPALGPTIGGIITEHLNWRWIFYVNLPVGAVGLAMALFLLREARPEGKRSWPFDWVGFTLLATALGSLITFLSKGQEKGWLQSDMILGLVLLFVVSAAAFLLWERRCRHPVLHLGLFQERSFAISVVSLALFSLTLYGVYFLLPLYMERLREWPALTSGLILLPGSVAMGCSLIVGGVLTDRWDPRPLGMACILAFALASFLFSGLDLYTPKARVAALFVLWGVAGGPLFPVLTTGGLSRLQEADVNMGSAIQNVSRLVAGSIGTAVATTVLARKQALFENLLAARTDPSNVQLLFQWEQVRHWAEMLSQGGREAEAVAAALFRAILQAKAGFMAFQATFQVMALMALAALPLLIFFKVGPNRGTRAVH